MRPALIFEMGNRYQDLEESDVCNLFGLVNVQKENEGWPLFEEEPLSPVLQLNLLDLPFKPKALAEVSCLALFVHSRPCSQDEIPKDSWCLRTYSRSDKLQKLQTPKSCLPLTPHFLQEPELVEDYPSTQLQTHQLEQQVWKQFKTCHPTQQGVKLGGWPSTSPSPANQQAPESVIQLQRLSEWHWKNGLSIQRGSHSHSQNWKLEWLP